MDPSKLVLPRLVFDGKKENFPYFRRSVLQTALAFQFGHFLDKPKKQAIAALALELSPPGGPDEVKQPGEAAVAKATEWYRIAAPIVATWLEEAVPSTYKALLLGVEMGNPLTTWTIIQGKGCTTTKAETRHYKKCLAALRMQGGVSLEEFIAKIILMCSLLLGCGYVVPDEDKLAVLYEGVTTPYHMRKTVLEADEDTTFETAVAAFTAISDDITRRRTHERAHNVHADRPPRRPKPSGNNKDRGRNRSEAPKEFCPICWAAKGAKFNHTADVCFRKHGYPEGHPMHRPSANLARTGTPEGRDEERAFFADYNFPPGGPTTNVPDKSERQDNFFGDTPSGEYDIVPPLPEVDDSAPDGSSSVFSAPIFLLLAFSTFFALGQPFVLSLLVGAISAASPVITTEVRRITRSLYDAISPTMTIACEAFSTSIEDFIPTRPSGRIFWRSASSGILSALLLLVVLASMQAGARAEFPPGGLAVTEHAFAANWGELEGGTSGFSALSARGGSWTLAARLT